MSDYSDLIKQARAVPGPTMLMTYPAQTTPDPLSNALADAIEAQAKEIAELKAELTSEQDRADRIAREWDALRWEQEASVEYSNQLRKSLKETLAVAERNELGDYQLRARAALKGER